MTRNEEECERVSYLYDMFYTIRGCKQDATTVAPT